jgi:hypothetical protein
MPHFVFPCQFDPMGFDSPPFYLAGRPHQNGFWVKRNTLKALPAVGNPWLRWPPRDTMRGSKNSSTPGLIDEGRG